MTTGVGQAPVAAPPHPISTWSRLYGFGSVYAKTMRDSRLAFLIAAGLLAGVMLVAGAGISTVYATQASRDEIVRLANELGAAGGIAGKPVNVGSLGGYIQWKYGPVFLWVVALWSILALSSTLATEARRGSLDIVAAAPFGKRRIALEKLAAHITVITLVMIIMAVACWLAGAVFGKLPGDAIPVQAAIGFVIWLEVVGLMFGALAFALAPFIGRGAAAGIAGGVLFLGYVLGNFTSAAPALQPVANLTPWAWTANHLPLAGQYDWASLVPVALIAIVLLAGGVEAFARRDLGVVSVTRLPGMPAISLGLGGPVGRAFGERLPVALGWGLGLGFFALLVAAISRTIADAVAQSPDLAKAFATAFPTFDLLTAGGFLQLMIQLLLIFVGFAAATLVSGWGSDETSGRLEMLLATPLDGRRWAVSSGLGVFAAIAVMTVLFAAGVAVGAGAAGSDALTPMVGSVTLGLYAAALCGIGFAVGGLFRASIAAEVVALVVIATYLVDLLVPALQLPDWVHQLALTAHLGQPMVGVWDVPGMVACIVLAVGGLLIGGWGMGRRDVAS
jgi:ABC-2 type transport system permease protein